MSGRMVRTITKVKDVNKLADHVTSDNDIITDIDGNVYLKNGTKNYIKLGLSGDTESLENSITTLKSENTKLKKRVSDLETSNEDLETSNKDLISRVEPLETSNEDLISRIEALENADTTE